MDNLKEIDKLLDSYNLPKLIQEDIEKMNKQITSKDIEMVIKNLPKNKSPGPDGFSGEFYTIFKQDLIPMPLKLFQAVEGDGRLPNSFYEANITLTAKAGKDSTKKEYYRPISLINTDAKILN